MLPQLRDRLRFLVERLFARGIGAQLLLVVSAVILISAGGGALATLLSPGEFAFPEAIWWAFLRLTDPGYLGDDTGRSIRALSTALTVAGYVVFLGALIAILTQWLHRTMESLGRGVTRYPGRTHIAVVGVTVRTSVILRQLLGAEGRMRRYLRSNRTARLRVVVLDQREDVRAGADLKSVVGRSWSRRKLIFRSGSPLRPDQLALLNASHAGAVIIPSADFKRSNVGLADAISIKALLSLRRAGEAAGGVPYVVAELREERNALIAHASFPGELEIVASDQVIGRLMALTVRRPGMSRVYAELLNHGLGSEVFVREYHGEDRSFGECAAHTRRGICIGVLGTHDGDSRLSLNPSTDTVVRDGDRLILIAGAYEETAFAPIAKRRRLQRGNPRPAPSSEPSTIRVLVLGWNSRVPEFVAELAQYGDAHYEITVVSVVLAAQRDRSISSEFRSDSESHPSMRVSQIEADYTDPDELAGIGPCEYDAVLLVASEWLETPEHADARTVAATLVIRHLCGSGRSPRLVVELSREESAELLPDDAADVIVSSQTVSYMLTQVALRRELNRVYTELFMPGGTEILAIPILHYLSHTDASSISFSDMAAAAARAGQTAIGYQTGQGDVRLNPPDDEKALPGQGVRVIVLESRERGTR